MSKDPGEPDLRLAVREGFLLLPTWGLPHPIVAGRVIRYDPDMDRLERALAVCEALLQKKSSST